MSVTRIYTNENAMFAARNFEIVGRNMSTTLERLSTGLRINKAADDPSGMALATNYERQIRGTQTAITNAEDTLNMLRYADEALNGISELMIRMSDLSLKAANEAVVTSADQADLSTEFKALKEAIASRTKAIAYNGRALFVGSYTGYSANGLSHYYLSKNAAATYRWCATMKSVGRPTSAVFAYGSNSGGLFAQIGADNGAAYRLTIIFGTINLTALNLTRMVFSTFTDDYGGGPRTFYVGGFGSATLGTSVKANASYARKWKERVDSAINTIGNIQAAVGIMEQRIETMIDGLTSEEVNLSAAKSRVMDADMAQEISELVRLQVISQAGLAALSQANIQPQQLLSLLGVAMS